MRLRIVQGPPISIKTWDDGLAGAQAWTHAELPLWDEPSVYSLVAVLMLGTYYLHLLLVYIFCQLWRMMRWAGLTLVEFNHSQLLWYFLGSVDCRKLSLNMQSQYWHSLCKEGENIRSEHTLRALQHFRDWSSISFFQLLIWPGRFVNWLVLLAWRKHQCAVLNAAASTILTHLTPSDP